MKNEIFNIITLSIEKKNKIFNIIWHVVSNVSKR